MRKAFRGSLRTRAHPAGSWWPHLRGVVRTEDRWSECSRAGGTGGSAEWPPRPLEPWGGTSPAHGPPGPQTVPPDPVPTCQGPLHQSLTPASRKRPQTCRAPRDWAGGRHTARAGKGDKEYHPGSGQTSNRPGREQAQETHIPTRADGGCPGNHKNVELKQTVDGSSLGGDPPPP